MCTTDGYPRKHPLERIEMLRDRRGFRSLSLSLSEDYSLLIKRKVRAKFQKDKPVGIDYGGWKQWRCYDKKNVVQLNDPKSRRNANYPKEVID